MEPKKSLNPSFEDIEAIANQQLAKSVGKFEAQNNQIQEKNGLVLKPKLSSFEPEPVPFKLVTNHVLHKKFPKAVSPEGEIMVRTISAFEEIYIDQFFGASEDQIANLITNIIEGCVKSDFPISELPLLDKIPLFFFIIAISYGSMLNIGPVDGCKTCIPGQTRVQLNYLEDIEIKRFESDIAYPRTINLTTYPNLRIKANIVMPVLRDEQILVNPPSKREDLIIKLRAIISDIYGENLETGESVTKGQMNEILAFLNVDDKEKIKEAVDGITTSYGVIYKAKIKNCSQENCSKMGQEVTITLQDLLMAFLIKSKQE